MRVKKAGGKVFGAVLSAAEKKAMDIEINRQIVEADRRYADDIDAMVLYTLHVLLGFGKKRLRKFYDAFSAEHDRLIQLLFRAGRKKICRVFFANESIGTVRNENQEVNQ